jgi:hypothetical protein
LDFSYFNGAIFWLHGRKTALFMVEDLVAAMASIELVYVLAMFADSWYQSDLLF